MAIEELKSVFRPVSVRREKDAESSRRGRKQPPPPKEPEESEPEEKRKVDIKV